MSKQNYNHTIAVNVQSAQAFESISQVSKWWATNFEGRAKDRNDRFTVRFGDTFVDFTISEVVPDKKVVWLVTDCNLHWLNDKKEWQHTTIDWEIAEQDSVTQIHMTHVGLIPAMECYSNCEKGWNFFVGESLYKLITEGQGLPETPKSLRQAEEKE